MQNGTNFMFIAHTCCRFCLFCLKPGVDESNDVIALNPASVDIVTRVREILTAHVAEGFLKSSDLADNQVLDTQSTGGSTIRINKYSSPKQVRA